MNNFFRFLLTILLFSGLLSLPNADAVASGGDRRKAVRPIPSNANVMAAQLALNSWVEPGNFRDACARSNFKALSVALNMNKDALQPEKGEFETREVFEKREASVRELMERRPFLICQRLDSESSLKFQYIGDFQHFLGAMPANNVVFSNTQFIKNYVGTSALGVRASIRETLERQYRLDIVSQKIKSVCVDIYLVGNEYQYFFKVPVYSNEAKILKETGKLVIVGIPSRPYVTEYFEDGEPSLDNPVDEKVHSLTVSVIPKSMHVIDGAGKEVWACEFTN